jgi:N-glycosylase/DNA lyase
VSFVRAIHSHGLVALRPGEIDDITPSYALNVRIGPRIRRLVFTQHDTELCVSTNGEVTARDRERIEALTRRIFRLDHDLSLFYRMIADDPRLSWAIGAGRLLCSPTVFEDTIKTICTTNCSWAATTRMIDALVSLGGGAFPGAQKLAQTPDAWFAQTARMGYRGPYVRAIANDVASGTLDLERLVPQTASAQETEEALLALPGIGPYAAAHTMQLLGFHHRLVLDSWTRPRYLKLSGKTRAKDATIVRDFKRYGAYAGLAFWLYLTRDWVTA